MLRFIGTAVVGVVMLSGSAFANFYGGSNGSCLSHTSEETCRDLQYSVDCGNASVEEADCVWSGDFCGWTNILGHDTVQCHEGSKKKALSETADGASQVKKVTSLDWECDAFADDCAVYEETVRDAVTGKVTTRYVAVFVSIIVKSIVSAAHAICVAKCGVGTCAAGACTTLCAGTSCTASGSLAGMPGFIEE
jgi:hypothetical protein